MFLCHDAKVTLFPDIRCAKIFWLGVGASTENPPCADKKRNDNFASEKKSKQYEENSTFSIILFSITAK